MEGRPPCRPATSQAGPTAPIVETTPPSKTAPPSRTKIIVLVRASSHSRASPAHAGPDHLHTFVSLDDKTLTLSAWMKSLKKTLSRTLRQQDITSPHWQQGFFDHVLRSSDSYTAKWHYVRHNPVRAGLVTQQED